MFEGEPAFAHQNIFKKITLLRISRVCNLGRSPPRDNWIRSFRHWPCLLYSF